MINPSLPEGQNSTQDPFEEYLASLPPKYGRKLLASEKCGLAYALHAGAKHAHVARAFNLSNATVSLLARCLDQKSRHYVEVRHEYERLGPEAFKEKYFSPKHEIYWRLLRVAKQLTHLPGGENDVAPRQTGPDPRAKKYSYREYGPIRMEDHKILRIDWIDGGWRYCLCNAAFEPVSAYFGADHYYAGEPRPFRTSAEAFDAAYLVCGFKSPRAKPGRPKNS